MSAAAPDRVVPLLKSVLLHVTLVALLGWSWWRWRAPSAPAAQQLAIEATMVTKQPAVAPAPAVAVPPGADEVALRRQEQAAQERHEQQIAAEAERAATLEAAAAKALAVKQEAERIAAAAAAAAAAQLAEQKAAAEKAAADKLLAQQRARDERDKLRREAELRASLAAEERVNAARASGAQAAYAALIRARIEQAWKRPPSTRAGLSCVVHVTQVPGGAVTAVSIGACNGDAAVRQSIEDAVYGASPLPMPAVAELFERDLVFTFKPDD